MTRRRGWRAALAVDLEAQRRGRSKRPISAASSRASARTQAVDFALVATADLDARLGFDFAFDAATGRYGAETSQLPSLAATFPARLADFSAATPRDERRPGRRASYDIQLFFGEFVERLPSRRFFEPVIDIIAPFQPILDFPHRPACRSSPDLTGQAITPLDIAAEFGDFLGVVEWIEAVDRIVDFVALFGTIDGRIPRSTFGDFRFFPPLPPPSRVDLRKPQGAFGGFDPADFEAFPPGRRRDAHRAADRQHRSDRGGVRPVLHQRRSELLVPDHRGPVVPDRPSVRSATWNSSRSTCRRSG